MENIRNKKLTKEEISIEAERRMGELLLKYPTRDHPSLLRFLNESKEIERWISDKMEKLEKCKK